LHASLLPRWRGAAPIHHAIMAGDAETGNSVITLAEAMDAGEVLGQSRRPIEPAQTTGELHNLLAADGPELVDGVLAAFGSGTLQRATQDESLVTLAPKLSKAEAAIDFMQPAEAVRATINGLSPWPGAEAVLGEHKLKLLRADRATTDRQAEAGAVLDADEGVIACGEGAIRLLEVQPGGKRAMGFADFARGRSIESGARFRPTTPVDG
ncbi:MAG: methionyl-tRNA formyltransferase, partial [Planctomycetota bacterium]